MKIGDILSPVLPDNSTPRCPFCGETGLNSGRTAYTCGFSGRWQDGSNKIKVVSICNNYKPSPALHGKFVYGNLDLGTIRPVGSAMSNKRKCHCDMTTIMRTGCQCGGE